MGKDDRWVDIYDTQQMVMTDDRWMKMMEDEGQMNEWMDTGRQQINGWMPHSCLFLNITQEPHCLFTQTKPQPLIHYEADTETQIWLVYSMIFLKFGNDILTL